MLFRNTYVYSNHVNACMGRINTKFRIVVPFAWQSVKGNVVGKGQEASTIFIISFPKMNVVFSIFQYVLYHHNFFFFYKKRPVLGETIKLLEQVFLLFEPIKAWSFSASGSTVLLLPPKARKGFCLLHKASLTTLVLRRASLGCSELCGVPPAPMLCRYIRKLRHVLSSTIPRQQEQCLMASRALCVPTRRLTFCRHCSKITLQRPQERYELCSQTRNLDLKDAK